MNEFKVPYQFRTNLAKYENGDVPADSHNILDKWNRKVCQYVTMLD